jgi:ATP-dependent DNA helicase RecG
LNIEFKQSRDSLSRSTFETICAFLNRKGGYILLGVKDNGFIEGIREDTLQTQLKTLANDMNNPQIISPTMHLETDLYIRKQDGYTENRIYPYMSMDTPAKASGS